MEPNDVRTSHECKVNNLPLAPPSETREPITKTEIKCLNGKGFLLHHVLTPSECQHYMAESDKAGFDELAGYKKNYRNNTRVTAFSHELAATIFARIKEFLPTEVVVDKEHEMEITAEFGTAGTWKLVGMNECWRMCKYTPGGLFAPHSDGTFVRNRSERSMYTFMIYLNGGFEGGETNFLKKDLELSMVDGKYVPREGNILESIKPEAGLAIIFLHPYLHEGATLKTGEKYIMRSDIMYGRTEKVATNPTEEQALKLFHEAQELEISEPMKAAELYRRAFKLSPDLANAYRM
eukprot:Phypoly_transcript_12747.p1 GENE.Phypoly_transcript_12747~~Phypoly_transcript_12747.p1  ORF type:complete len:293 (+),score=57.48 Phypoly_transcript_12747:127-1005(+)